MSTHSPRIFTDVAEASFSHLRYVKVLLVLILLITCVSYASSTVAPSAARKAAVMQARHGDAKGALGSLQALLIRYPDDPRLLADTAIVANWAGDDALALQLYSREHTPKDDIGVTEAAARSARNLHRFNLALGLYQRAEELSPERWQARLGESLVLVDKGDLAAAAALMRPLVRDHGEVGDVLTGNAYLCERQRDFACVLDMNQRLLKLGVRTQETKCQIADALSAMGAASIALKTCQNATKARSRRLFEAAGAEQVRWGDVYGPAQEQREQTEKALATLNNVIDHSTSKDDVWKRAEFDRLQALSDLHRMRDVVKSYEQLRKQGTTLPPYALQAVAGAYLALREPATAEKLYLNLVAVSPRNGELWSALAYAQFEEEHIGKAFRTIDQAYRNSPAWLTAPGLKVLQRNSLHTRLGLQAAEMRGYAGLLAQEQARLKKLLDLAPANTEIRRQMALTYLDRGWPKRALEEDRIARSYAQPGETPFLETVEIQEGAGRRDVADAMLPIVLKRDGMTPRMANFLLRRRIAHGWQMTASGSAEWSSGTYLATTDLHNEVRVDSPFLANRWRIFGHGWFDDGEFAQGTATRYRAGGGISYSYARQSIWGEIAEDTGTAGSTFAGSLGVNLNFGDHWSAHAVGDSDNMPDVQLISAFSRVRARSVDANLSWHANELRDASLSMQRLLFTDGNQRLSLSTGWNEQIHTSPRLQVILSPQGWASFNSKDANRQYFNPKSDVSLGPQAAFHWLTWRKYDRSLRQNITLYVASNWQQNYGYGIAGSVTYVQRWKLGNRFGIYIGTSWNSQPYDGNNDPYTAVQYGVTLGSQ